MDLQKQTTFRHFFSEVNLSYKSKRFERLLDDYINLGNEFENYVHCEMFNNKGDMIESMFENLRSLEDYSEKYCSASIYTMRSLADEYTERINGNRAHYVHVYYEVIEMNQLN